jgi:hypothetical protein
MKSLAVWWMDGLEVIKWLAVSYSGSVCTVSSDLRGWLFIEFESTFGKKASWPF